MTYFRFLLMLSLISLLPRAVQAQQIVPAADGTGTAVQSQGDRFNISGGKLSGDRANLFHSFSQFNLSEGQIANFLTNPAIKNILTRVVGGDVSLINGLISVSGGNSNLFLMNPAGIVFGQGARLDVPGSFLATTANGIGFGDRTFNVNGFNDYSALIGMPSAFYFGPQAGVIINGGNLAVGERQSLSLLGGAVINTGQLWAPGGTITIAAVPGENVVRISQAGHLLSLEIGSGESVSAMPAAGFAYALPKLLAGVGGSDATGVAVNSDGTVQLTATGTTIPVSAGTAMPAAGFAYASGSLDVSSSSLSGGQVAILGDRVGVISANINASGTNGGTVLIGGNYRGTGNFNAFETFVSNDSTIATNAISSGNGGRVIVWADGTTGFFGNITARGGILRGDGGFVEVSGKNSLSFAGGVDTRATNGAIGTLLLDPSDIIIEAGAGSSEPVVFRGDRTATQIESNPTMLSEVELESIAAGTNIILETSNSITLNNLPDNVLALQAGRGDAIAFKTGGVFLVNDPNDLIQTQGGDLNITAASISVGKLDANGGNITLTGNGIDLRGGDASARSVGGTIRLEPLTGRDIRLGGTGDNLGILDLTARDINAIADGFSAIAIGRSDGSGVITVVNPVTFNDTVTLQGGAIVVNGAVTGTGNAAIALNAASSTLNANITGGNITFGGNILLGNDVTVSTQGRGNIILPGTVDGNQRLGLEGLRVQLGGSVGENIPLTSLNVNAQNTEVSGNITAASITFDSAVAIAQSASFIASGDLSFANTVDSMAGKANNLEIKTGGNITFGGAVGGGEKLGAIALTSAGNVTANSTITASSLRVSATEAVRLQGNVAVSGGDIFVEGGSVASQDLNASGVRGGNIEVRSSREIIAGNVSASGSTGSGGNIFLNAEDNIEVGAIESQGGSNGNGGSVAIATNRFFLASGSFRDLEGITSSISTVGGQGGGAIAIRYGGDREQSFVVGNATRNGTRGAINAGVSNIILPSQSFEGTYRQGNSPNQIALITTGNSPTPTPNPTPNPTPTPTPNPTPIPLPSPSPSPSLNPTPTPSPNPIPLPSPSPNPVPIPTPNPTPNPVPNPTPSPNTFPLPATSAVSIATNLQGETRSPQSSSQREYGPKPDIPIPSLAINVDLAGVLASEENFTREYEKYLELPAREPISNISVVYDTLRKNEAVTGIKSAIIYMNWVRGSVSAVRQNAELLKVRPESSNQLSINGVSDSDRLELAIVSPSGQTIRALVPGVTRSQLLQVAESFQSDIINPQLRNTAVYLEPAQQLYRWLIAPLETDLKALNIQNLIIIPAAGLRSVPFAALHNGQQFLVENYSISIMPSFSLTDTRYEDISTQEVLGMGVSVFADKPPLPAVPIELSAIASPEQGKSFLNEDFTLANLQAQRAMQPFGIIHLATHSEFQPGVPSNSYIQLWDTKLRLDQMRQLKWNDPPVNLLVLSACSTALGDEQAELGFAGLAVASGARSALASLWEVSDEGTLGLMAEFYQQLRSHGENNRPIIKAEALRQAQLAMLRGQVRLEGGVLRVAGRVDAIALPTPIAARGNRLLSHPYYWAAFTMIGNPW